MNVDNTAPTRRRLRAAGRREQLLDVATDLLAEVGFRGMSVELLARRAGITRAVVYRHFPDLETLLETAVERAMVRALEQVAATTLPDMSAGDPIGLMVASLSAYLTAVRDNPATWRLVMLPPEGSPELLQRSIAAGRATVLGSLTRAVGSLLGQQGLGDVELTARVMQAVADAYARLVLVDPAEYSRERLVAHLRWLLELAPL